MLTVTVNCAEPPCGLLTVTVHVPEFSGVTLAVNVFPLAVGFATWASSPLVPALQAASGTTVSDAVATFTVIVTVCAYAEPVPENVSELGLRLNWPGGGGLPVGSDGGFVPPP